MDPDELGPAREFVRRHHLHYDVRDELVVEGEQRRRIGYRLRLWGVVPRGGLLPGDVVESPFAQELVSLAEQVVPEDRGGANVVIEPPAPALYDSRVVSGADEIALDIRLLRTGAGDPAGGTPEDGCLKAIRKALEALGAPQRD
jgi:hypothetical protein